MELLRNLRECLAHAAYEDRVRGFAQHWRSFVKDIGEDAKSSAVRLAALAIEYFCCDGNTYNGCCWALIGCVQFLQETCRHLGVSDWEMLKDCLDNAFFSQCCHYERIEKCLSAYYGQY